MNNYKYEVALSYASEDRKYVNAIAESLKEKYVKVFFDQFYITELWGKNLIKYLYEVYKNRSEYIIIFYSKNYAKKMWTKHELESAQSKTIEEEDFILPILLDDSVVPNELRLDSYLDARNISQDDVVTNILKKLKANDSLRDRFNKELMFAHGFLEPVQVTSFLLSSIDDEQSIQEIKKIVKLADNNLQLIQNGLKSLLITLRTTSSFDKKPVNITKILKEKFKLIFQFIDTKMEFHIKLLFPEFDIFINSNENAFIQLINGIIGGILKLPKCNSDKKSNIVFKLKTEKKLILLIEIENILLTKSIKNYFIQPLSLHSPDTIEVPTAFSFSREIAKKLDLNFDLLSDEDETTSFELTLS